LASAAGDRLGRNILLTGPVVGDQVVEYMAAMDVGSLPQSVDSVGSFRYTTKLSEYLAARLPVVTGQIPLAYDLDNGWLWRLPGKAPWQDDFGSALTSLMRNISLADIAARRLALPVATDAFNSEQQISAVTAFIADLLDNTAPSARRISTEPTLACPIAADA
jgi:hypothetical protein